MANAEQTIFYSIEETIKSYRQFAQKNITDAGHDITIDQGLVLSIINGNPEISQKEVAARAFKDHASITRIVELLVGRGLLRRDYHAGDRRRVNLNLTEAGEARLKHIEPVINGNRRMAVAGITTEEIKMLKNILGKITSNCRN